MNYLEFMRLPIESRKVIEQCIIDLDKAVQDEYGFSMLGGDIKTVQELNAPTQSAEATSQEGSDE